MSLSIGPEVDKAETIAAMKRTSQQVSLEQHNEDRMRRAQSWFERSKIAEANRKKAGNDKEMAAAFDCEQFIFLWISFNAAYGRELLDVRDGRYRNENKKFNEFLAKILKRDSDQVIKTILWETYSDAVRVLLKNQYVFGPFWDAVRGSGNDSNWKDRFNKSNRKAFSALIDRDDIHTVLEEVFARLYVLRNQLFHGGATFATGWGRSQVRDGSRIMASLVPEILKIMQTDIEMSPDSNTWGTVAFPRVNESPDSGIR